MLRHRHAHVTSVGFLRLEHPWFDDDVENPTHGLPLAAQKRIDHQRASGVASSLFSAPAAAAAQSAALEPVGEVFGCVVMNLGYFGGGCGWWSAGGSGTGYMNTFGSGFGGSYENTYSGPTSPITTTGRGGANSSHTPYVRAFEAAWAAAIERLLNEARGLGAHGVVGVRIERTRLDGHAWEFSALGTAVRSTDVIRAPRLKTEGGVWCTNLSAEDSASAILSGFIPREIVMGLSVATKHEDWQLRQQRGLLSNQEITGMTELIRAARNESRQLLQSHTTHTGAAELVVTDMHLREFETPCGTQEGRDLHAEAIIVGTTLVPIPRFYKKPPEASRVLTVLSLRDGQRP
jgi:uncharacterized protein YbjQ (UPF0145 family)